MIDKLEELFAASVDDAERNAFIDLVAALVGTGRVWVVATLRADFYARMLVQPGLKKLKELGAIYDLSPPGPVELAEIVRGPADAAGLIFETDAATGERLDTRLLRDADRPNILPLVQLAPSRLLDGREVVGGVTVEGYCRKRDRGKNAYERRQFEVLRQGDNASPITVWTYFVVNKLKSPPRPSAAYKATLLNGARHWRLPAHYIDELEGIDSSATPTPRSAF